MSHNGLFGGAFMAMKEDIAAHRENPFCLQGGLAAVLVAGFALGRTGAIYESTTLILDSFELLAATKLVKAGVFVALALLFFYGGKSEGRSKDRTGTLLVMTLVAFAVYGAIFLSGNLAGVTSFGFQILGLVMEGASEAIGIYLYAAMMAQMNPGPELMLLGFAATNGISAVLSTLLPVPNAYLLLAFQIVGLLALAFTMRYLEPASGAMPMAAVGRLPGETESAGLFAFVAACLFVNAVAGFYISIPSVGGTPLSGAEKSIIGVRVRRLPPVPGSFPATRVPFSAACALPGRPPAHAFEWRGGGHSNRHRGRQGGSRPVRGVLVGLGLEPRKARSR